MLEINIQNPYLKYLKTSGNPLVFFGTNDTCGDFVKLILDKNNIKIDFVAVDAEYYMPNTFFMDINVSSFQDIIENNEQINVIIGIQTTEKYLRKKEQLDKLSKVAKTINWDYLQDNIAFCTKDEGFIFEHIDAIKNLQNNEENVFKNYHEKHCQKFDMYSAKPQIEIHLVDHCNLNCVYCNGFNPVAKPNFLDLEQYRKDLEKLSILTNAGEKIDRLILLGGEPLLNPEITKYLEIAGKNITNCPILLFTNGILLPYMNKEFWKSCCNNNVIIMLTLYPVKIDFNKINALSMGYCVKISLFAIRNHLFTFKLDIKGKQSPVDNIKKCLWAKCTELRNGKIYRCARISHSEFLEKKFNISFPKCNEDCIDIHKVQCLQEIEDYLAMTTPFCRFCIPPNKDELVEWKVSSRKLEEWVEE